MNDEWDNMDYEPPTTTICPDCGEECTIVPLDNSFDYAGTHCTHGRSGTHKPEGYGTPVSDCCDAEIEI
jgi:hypothetical protein